MLRKRDVGTTFTLEGGSKDFDGEEHAGIPSRLKAFSSAVSPIVPNTVHLSLPIGPIFLKNYPFDLISNSSFQIIFCQDPPPKKSLAHTSPPLSPSLLLASSLSSSLPLVKPLLTWQSHIPSNYIWKPFNQQHCDTELFVIFFTVSQQNHSQWKQNLWRYLIYPIAPGNVRVSTI